MRRSASPRRPPAPPNDAFCGECGAPQRPIDRVCRRCGTLTTLGEYEKRHGRSSHRTPPPAVQRALKGKRPAFGLLIVIVVAAVLVALFGRGDAETNTLNGTIILIDRDVTGQETDCQPTRGYDDLGYGAAVLLVDQDGDTVATGSITTEKTHLGGCAFGFTVAGIPDRDTYRIRVTHRNGRVWSRAELESEDWFVTLNAEDDLS